ncbi:MAG: hypothetical protein RBS80_22030 [Thermoguttaceae bacterium]|jgi:hypothetical protein|nr:hypothetical protein [Thermoguttaceae bacterium]
MTTRGFHSEWVTIGHHRVLLECRASYPDDEMRFIARVAVATIDHNSQHGARLVHVYYDDKSCFYTVKIASDNAEDDRLADIVMRVLHTMRNDGNCQPEVEIVAPGDRQSDHYEHMEHLSIQSQVAVDRSRHRDTEYMQQVESPR